MPYCSEVEKWLVQIKAVTKKKFNFETMSMVYYALIEEITKATQTEEYKKSLQEIEKDIDRTFPQSTLFKRTIEGKSTITQLKNLLRAIVKYNPKMGYVQGMNFLVATLFYHSCEVAAFWIFEILLNCYGGLDIYTGDLYAVYMHCEVVNLLLEVVFPEIWAKMVI